MMDWYPRRRLGKAGQAPTCISTSKSLPHDSTR